MPLGDYYVGSTLDTIGNNMTRDVMSQRENDRLTQAQLMQAWQAQAEMARQAEAARQFNMDYPLRRQAQQQQADYQNALLALQKQQAEFGQTQLTPAQRAQVDYNLQALNQSGGQFNRQLDVSSRQFDKQLEQSGNQFNKQLDVTNRGMNYDLLRSLADIDLRDRQLTQAGQQFDLSRQLSPREDAVLKNQLELQRLASQAGNPQIRREVLQQNSLIDAENVASQAKADRYKQKWAAILDKIKYDSHWWNNQPRAVNEAWLNLQREMEINDPDKTPIRMPGIGVFEPIIKPKLQYNPMGANAATGATPTGTPLPGPVAAQTSPAVEDPNRPIMVRRSDGTYYRSTAGNFRLHKMQDPGAQLFDLASPFVGGPVQQQQKNPVPPKAAAVQPAAPRQTGLIDAIYGNVRDFYGNPLNAPAEMGYNAYENYFAQPYQQLVEILSGTGAVQPDRSSMIVPPGVRRRARQEAAAQADLSALAARAQGMNTNAPAAAPAGPAYDVGAAQQLRNTYRQGALARGDAIEALHRLGLPGYEAVVFLDAQ